MKKYFVILFFIVSVLFFLISVKEVYSVSVGQPGDMVSCMDNFKYCTDGGCTQTDRTFAIRCKIRNCSNGCKKYNNNRCIKWSYWTLNCTGGEMPGMGGVMCEPITLISSGVCLPIRIQY